LNSLNNVERLRERMSAPGICLATGITLSDPSVSELVGQAGYDFTWIDSEHGSFDLPTIAAHIMAVRGTQTAPVVRVPCNDRNVIKPVLDLAPAGIIVPMVNSAKEAEEAVAACRYPPVGVRGFGPKRGIRYGDMTMDEYLETADQQIIVIVQIEHADAVDNIEEILQVPGLDSICIGPNDLSGSFGKLGQIDDPEVVAAMNTVVEKAAQSPVAAGVSTGYNPATVSTWLEKGFQWINFNVDWQNLFIQSKFVIDSLREAESKR